MERAKERLRRTVRGMQLNYCYVVIYIFILVFSSYQIQRNFTECGSTVVCIVAGVLEVRSNFLWEVQRVDYPVVLWVPATRRRM